MIRDRHAQRLSISEIARRTGHRWNTVRNYLKSTEPPRYLHRDQRSSVLDPYKVRIKILLDGHGERSLVRLFKAIGGPL